MTAAAPDTMPREQRAAVCADAEAVRRLAATLDWPRVPQAGEPLPLLWHWLLVTPRAPTAELSADGHPAREGTVPEVTLPRRMWASSRLRFPGALHVGAPVERHSTIQAVQHKQGRSGPLAFVTFRHDYAENGAVQVEEEQVVAYREEARPGVAVPPPRRPELQAQFSRTIEPSAALLFRYSAVTFNAHRIHYDRDYVTRQEGYPGLLVQGPLTATLLAGLFEQHHPRARVRALTIRAEAALFDVAPFSVHGRRDGARAMLWAQTPEGGVAMSVELELDD